jgi:transposase
VAAAYSYDLRKKAMEALDEGESRQAVAVRFKLGATTLYEWQQRRKETRDFVSWKQGNRGYNHKITDWKVFEAFAQEYGHKTQSEMAELWHVPISRQTIHRALKKIGFTHKKRLTDIKKETRQSGLNS